MSRFPKYAKAFSRNTEPERVDGDCPRGKKLAGSRYYG
jgi:hypothetical protein